MAQRCRPVLLAANICFTLRLCVPKMCSFCCGFLHIKRQARERNDETYSWSGCFPSCHHTTEDFWGWITLSQFGIYCYRPESTNRKAQKARKMFFSFEIHWYSGHSSSRDSCYKMNHLKPWAGQPAWVLNESCICADF